jgi:Lysine-specific metallo-endopeptidase
MAQRALIDPPTSAKVVRRPSAAAPEPSRGGVEELLMLQRSAGNAAVARLLGRPSTPPVEPPKRPPGDRRLRDAGVTARLDRCAGGTCSCRSCRSAEELEEDELARGQMITRAAARDLQRCAVGNRAVNRVLARDGTTAVRVEVAPGGCSLAQHRAIEPAVTTAAAWLRRSMRLIDAFIANPTADATAATRRAMRRNFASTTLADATHVRGRFATILNDMLTSPTLTTECHTNADRQCGAANAYVRGRTFVFCPIFFDFSPLARAASVIHEMAHALTDGPHITDRAYRSNRYYRWMTPAEARTNAESYGMLARELGTGTAAPDTAARDTIEDCPPDWDVALARATAIAERWNRNAQSALRNRRPSRLAGWTDLQTRYLGSTTTAALDRAQQVYDAAQTAFKSSIDFECEPGATGGRCGRYETYWYGWMSDLHICPSWRALPTEAARTESLLRGFYGYKDIIGDDRRRANLAALARELTARYWPAPAP